MARKSKHQGSNSSNKRPKVEEKLEDAVWFLKKCNAPAEIIKDAEKILNTDTSSLGDVQKILQRALKLLNNHNIANFETLKKEYDAIRKDLEDTLSAIENGKYEGSLNFGDGISLLTCAIIIKHYAPWSCRGYECRRGFVANLIKRTNQCIVPFLNNIPKSLNKEAGYDWGADIAKSVDDSVAFVDMRIITPKKKKKCKSEFNTFYKDANITERDANLLGFILYAFHVKAHHVNYGEVSWSIPVACATKEGWQEVFKSSEEVDTGVIKFLKYVAHGQCWAMRLPLMNEDVHTDELLDHYNYALVELYKYVPLLNLPDLSRIAHRFGARCGENLTDEERAERKVCSPSADMKEAWRAYHADEELTPEQQRLVRYGAAVIEAFRAGKAGDTLTTAQQELLKDHHGWLTFEAWNDYHAHGGDMSQLSPEQQELLKDSYFWKVHVAWKEYHAHGGDITKLSDEQQEILMNCHGWKVHVAWKEYHAHGGDITKLSKEDQELLLNCHGWKLHDEALTKHAKTIQQMKKDRSNYVQVGDEEVLYIPTSESALYQHVLKLRRVKEGDKDHWMKQKFEREAGISLSKMEEAYSQLRMVRKSEKEAEAARARSFITQHLYRLQLENNMLQLQAMELENQSLHYRMTNQLDRCTNSQLALQQIHWLLQQNANLQIQLRQQQIQQIFQQPWKKMEVDPVEEEQCQEAELQAEAELRARIQASLHSQHASRT